MLETPIFVGGAGRSGTTLTRVILDSHPSIACGPEMKVLPKICQLWQDCRRIHDSTLRSYFLSHEDLNAAFARMVTSLLEPYHRDSGKPRIAEKSPNNVLFFRHLHVLFPASPLIHVIRDGRDVVCSLLTMNWVNPSTGEPLDYTRDVRKAAGYWVKAVQAGRTATQKPSFAERYHELRYEDIIANTEPALRALFAFLGEPWDDGVLSFHEKERHLAAPSNATEVSQPIFTRSLGRWKTELPPAQKDAVKEVAGELLIELGYARNMDW